MCRLLASFCVAPTHAYPPLWFGPLTQAYKSLIHVGKDLGVPVELVDPAVYEGGKNFIMHPHDEALLKDPPSAKNQSDFHPPSAHALVAAQHCSIVALLCF